MNEIDQIKLRLSEIEKHTAMQNNRSINLSNTKQGISGDTQTNNLFADTVKVNFSGSKPADKYHNNKIAAKNNENFKKSL